VSVAEVFAGAPAFVLIRIVCMRLAMWSEIGIPVSPVGSMQSGGGW
jgi:hypothetical protein